MFVITDVKNFNEIGLLAVAALSLFRIRPI
jgi:hypothetical protein